LTKKAVNTFELWYMVIRKYKHWKRKEISD